MLPPHLSPFETNALYKPEREKELKQLQGEEVLEEEEDDEEIKKMLEEEQ